jgi:hypothetical protein
MVASSLFVVSGSLALARDPPSGLREGEPLSGDTTAVARAVG